MYAPKRKKAQTALKLLRDHGPSYPGLHSHKYESMARPNGEEVWESYLENQTPRAWRAFWHSVGADTIRILTLQPHP
ncbi:hypothetical protein B1B_13156 [mine drainage metagenome]|uniref:Uncharacterized protein n=1 Tax=mine drainage metagenome TaxID=410659 RepID=T1AWY2_9ZZZZ